ncbi:hypothetical protein HDU67_010046 [Dinochytrium kinnereticum]|nr:hypothetical protein HDU67_010046 [Dinochytrium kinnereticum]
MKSRAWSIGLVVGGLQQEGVPARKNEWLETGIKRAGKATTRQMGTKREIVSVAGSPVSVSGSLVVVLGGDEEEEDEAMAMMKGEGEGKCREGGVEEEENEKEEVVVVAKAAEAVRGATTPVDVPSGGGLRQGEGETGGEVTPTVVVKDPFALLLGPPEVKSHSPLRPSLRRKRSVPLYSDQEVTTGSSSSPSSLATITTPPTTTTSEAASPLPPPPSPIPAPRASPSRHPSPASLLSTTTTSSTTAVDPSPSSPPRRTAPTASRRKPSPKLDDPQPPPAMKPASGGGAGGRTRPSNGIMWADLVGGTLEVHHDFSDYLDRVEMHRERRRQQLLARREREEEGKKQKGFFEILSANPVPMYAFG